MQKSQWLKNILPHFLVKGTEVGTQGWTSFLHGGSGLAGQVSDKALMDNDKNWVYISVDKIAENISMIPYHLMKFKRNGDDEEVFDHPVLDILDNPNHLMSGVELLYYAAAHLELTGNAYWLKDLEKNPKSLTPLFPEYTKIIMADGLMDIDGYDYRVGSFHRKYKPELVTHIKYPNPRNPLKGRGTLSQIAEWVDVDSYATEFNRKFFINGVAVGGALETEATTKEAMEMVKLGFEMKYQGASNAHKVSVLPKGTKYIEPKSTQRDMEFNQSLIQTRNNILAAFGVPKSVIGISETGDSKSDAEAAHFAFMFFTIAPKIKRLEKFLNERFLPAFDKSGDLFLKFDDPVPDNQEATVKRRETELAKGAWKTVNEIRAEDGLDPLEGGDELKSGGATFQLSQEAKKINKRAPYRRMEVAASTKDKREITTKNIVDAAMGALNKANEETKEELEESNHKDFIDRTEKKVDKLADNFKDLDRDLKVKVLAQLEEIQDPSDIKKYTIKGLGDNLIDREAAVKSTIEFSDPIFQDIIKTEGAERFAEVSGAVGNFDPQEPGLQKILEQSLKRMAESYTDTTIKILEAKLLEAIEGGDSMVDIRNMVAEVFEFTEKFRAQRIAHTEVFRAANMAGRQAFKQSEVVESVRWHTAADDLVCEFCRPINGKIVGIDEAYFKQGETVHGDEGGKIDTDYAEVMDPPVHANCRCFILPEVIDIGEASAEDVAETKDEDGDDGETSFLEEAISIMQHGKEQKTTQG